MYHRVHVLQLRLGHIGTRPFKVDSSDEFAVLSLNLSQDMRRDQRMPPHA